MTEDTLDSAALTAAIQEADKKREAATGFADMDAARVQLASIVTQLEASAQTLDRDRLLRQTCLVYAVTYTDQGIFSEAEKWMKRAEGYSEGADAKERAHITLQLADIHRQQGKECVEEFKSAISELEKHDDAESKHTMADAYGSLAHAYSASGHLTEALESRFKALENAQTEIAKGIFKGDLAKDQYRLGKLEEAEKQARESILITEGPHPRSGGYTHRVLGDILIAKEDIHGARSEYELAARSESPEGTLSHCNVMGKIGLGWWELRFGSPETAEAAFSTALNQEDPALKTEAMAGLALALRKQGKDADAQKMLEDALQQPTAKDNVYVRAHVKAVEAALLRAQKREVEAVAIAKESDEAFASSAKPLIGLSEVLAKKIARLDLPASGVAAGR